MKEYSIHQVKDGDTQVMGGDANSVQMVWNNITGANFDSAYDHMIYMESVVFGRGKVGQMGLEKRILFLKEDDKIIETYGKYREFHLIAFPFAKDFENLFTVVGKAKKYKIEEMGDAWCSRRMKDQSVGIMEFKGIEVQCSDGIIKHMEDRMIYGLTGDAYYFETHDDKDGKTRIYLKYNKIIGSHFIGWINTDSIPKIEGLEILDPVERAIAECTIEDNTVFLPVGQLDKVTYAAVKKKLQNIGGKWSTSAQGFVFLSDPSELLGRVKDGEKINLKQDYQFFETPLKLATRMVRIADIKKGEAVLEPSAGKGIIADRFRDDDLTLCELMPENIKELKRKYGSRVHAGDFLEFNPDKKFDKIIANPPFTKNQDIDHVRHMYELLKDGGRIVTIMSTSWVKGEQKYQKDFRMWLDELGASIEEIEAGAFKDSGTGVATTLVIIDKH